MKACQSESYAFKNSVVTEYSLRSFQQVHGRNLLSIDYDRNIRTEKIYDDHRKFTLRIIYDQLGRPFLWLPSSGLAAVNVSYFFNGRLAGLQRGAMSERTDIDKQGRIISRMFADGKVWSYTYLEKVGAAVLHSDMCYKESTTLIRCFILSSIYSKFTQKLPKIQRMQLYMTKTVNNPTVLDFRCYCFSISN